MNSITNTAVDSVFERAPAVPQPQPHRHMPPLDGLRGIAILLVLVDHFCKSMAIEFSIGDRLMKYGELGWTGVDLFFVLSGFLITGILYDAKGTPCFFRNFYARRALRIFPLYYTALAMVMLMTPILVRLRLQGTENPAWMSIYATNFVMSVKGEGAFGVLDHFWSLAVEEHYYFIWPAIVFALDRKRLMWVAAAACLLAPVLRFTTLNAGANLPITAYVVTPMRMDSLAAGSFIALFVRGPVGMRGLVKPAMAVAVAASALFLAMVLTRHSRSPHDAMLGTFGFSVLWAFYGAVLVLALNWQPLKAITTMPVLRWFGKYSYGMYVWHPVVLMLVFHNDLAREIRNGNGPVQALLTGAIGLAGIFAITLASWHLWEKQFLKLKTRFA